jgi:hypothetical protein
MEFIEFVRALPQQKSKNRNIFIAWAKEQKDFPVSSDPNVLSLYLYDKLDWDLTHSFQMLYMMYEYKEPNHRIPEQHTGLSGMSDAIQIIVKMKNKAGHKRI